jgi:hypothetical protein
MDVVDVHDHKLGNAGPAAGHALVCCQLFSSMYGYSPVYWRVVNRLFLCKKGA